ncbi:hypothetical protein [Sphingobium boeckii]|uniref:DUF4349 domain-containing protein n=1 Tax=Sphingobium boeckii TaxID=1082345 RepID=A0A7W9AHC3_9SPHN|nr:hypothetical protein [Sphingobium boeckii]MBB5685426.1 hypothetical protein [Sphingobium boeckii]
MRKSYTLLMLVALAGCSKPQERSDQPNADVAEEALSAPNIGPTAAPGVAFNYRYAFRLPATRIGEVQERHAQACEKLGIDRCRITGMRYRLVNNHDVDAMLAFKLEPTLARQFGKDGIAAITQAKGMLVDSEISGEDVGTAITVAQKAEARLRSERARIEARLKAPNLPAAERARLDAELADLARSTEASTAGREEKQESLATTPMVFNYGSGELIPGFDARSPLREAFGTAGATIVGVVAFLIVVLGGLIPFAILGGAIGFAWRAIRPTIRKWQEKPEKDANS